MLSLFCQGCTPPCPFVKELFLGALVCDELLLGAEHFVQAATENHCKHSYTVCAAIQHPIKVLLLVRFPVLTHLSTYHRGNVTLFLPDEPSYSGGV